VLQLAGEHRLRLADRVNRWLPGLVPNGRRITIRNLLQHTSGLADFELDPRVLEPYQNGDLAHRWAPIDLARIGVSNGRTIPPRGTYAYSNTNYVLLGLIVKKVTGRSFGHALRSRILAPLHLRETTFPTTAAMPRPHAHGYRVFDQPPAIDITGLYPYPWAAGAMVSTGRDVLRFYHALLGGRLLKPGMLRAMRSHTLPPAGGFDIKGQTTGLGLERFPMRCGIAYGDNGDIPGFFTYAFTSPNARHQAVLMVNQDAMSLPKAAAGRFSGTLERAFCARG
jgi:D-alanyl-D-alanine carboxypeptidase